MADDKEAELELDKAGGGKKKLIIIIALVVILAGGGAGAFFFMGGEEPTAEQSEGNAEGADGEAGAEGGKINTGSAIYVPLPRAFRFSVPGATRDRFVEIKAQLLVRGGDHEETAKKHIPLIESTLLGVFSQANADDLATSAGKESLKANTLKEIKKVLLDITDNEIVEEVLFTGFVMQ